MTKYFFAFGFDMFLSELCKIIVNKITFVDLRGCDRPPLVPPLRVAWFTVLA